MPAFSNENARTENARHGRVDGLDYFGVGGKIRQKDADKQVLKQRTQE